MVFHGDDAFDDCIVDPFPNGLHIDAQLLQVRLQVTDGPLVAVVPFLE